MGPESNGAIRIVDAASVPEYQVGRALIEEYASSLPIDLSFQGFEEEISQFPGEYAPPKGAVLIAYSGPTPSGVVALRPHGSSACEMKRLYVRPAFRGHGIGRMLSLRIIQRATELHYALMRIDTLPSMDAAIGLYRALGFRHIPPYRYNPVAGAVFMELALAPT